MKEKKSTESRNKFRFLVTCLIGILFLAFVYKPDKDPQEVAEEAEIRQEQTQAETLAEEIAKIETVHAQDDGSVVVRDKGASVTFAPMSSNPPVIPPDRNPDAVSSTNSK